MPSAFCEQGLVLWVFPGLQPQAESMACLVLRILGCLALHPADGHWKIDQSPERMAALKY